ncbi:UDP-glucose/GDP-mannose dehydrogenase family protein [uncultured Selenomonas sp.]|uniref:UDP-glucose dehydrogenase family protein n=1 Tax=uncultured Selenomonas sp. TaxID=159275 RepID=UPI0025D50CE9|nr:nucleotide sugar dehydrogenase [uncultured Selenomonas sp.]
MVITIFGMGFVGLTTALGFAEFGHEVYGVEVNAEKLAGLQAGKLPFVEPGMDAALTKHVGKDFHAIGYDGLDEALAKSDVVYYCVGTPYGEDGAADLHYLLGAVKDTLERLPRTGYPVLVVKSTVPPSTAEKEIIPFVEKLGWKVGKDLGIGNNPEFLREGHCWDDFMHADRIVLGASDQRTEDVLRKVYEGTDFPVFCVTLNTAEFIKYLSNTLLATLISFSNEMANTAYAINGIQIKEAFDILRMDKRWGNASMTSYVYPGCGYGGYCLPKDTNAFYALSEKVGRPAKMLQQTIRVNDQMAEAIAGRIEDFVKQDKQAKIGVLGLSFKPESDDVRDTPAARILRILAEDGYTNLLAYDPLAMENFSAKYDLPVQYERAYEDVLQKADHLVILTAWQEFADVRERTEKDVLDCRYMLAGQTA